MEGGVAGVTVGSETLGGVEVVLEAAAVSSLSEELELVELVRAFSFFSVFSVDWTLLMAIQIQPAGLPL